MRTRHEWSCALVDRCATALRLSDALAADSDSLVNYDRGTRKELGDVFAVAAGVVLLCRAKAVSRDFTPMQIQRYDRLFSIFSRYAFKSMMGCGAYASMDAIRERCDSLATGIAERFRHYEVEPFAVINAATELATPPRARQPAIDSGSTFRAFLRRFRPSVIRSAASTS